MFVWTKHEYYRKMAMAISYNWLFQWEKHFINGVWGWLLSTYNWYNSGHFTGISLYPHFEPQFTHESSSPTQLFLAAWVHMECSIIQIFNSKIQLPQGKFPNGTGGRRHFLCLNVARFWPLRENFRYAWTASCSSVERSLDAEFLWKDSGVQNLPDPSTPGGISFAPAFGVLI